MILNTLWHAHEPHGHPTRVRYEYAPDFEWPNLDPRPLASMMLAVRDLSSMSLPVTFMWRSRSQMGGGASSLPFLDDVAFECRSRSVVDRLACCSAKRNENGEEEQAGSQVMQRVRRERVMLAQSEIFDTM